MVRDICLNALFCLGDWGILQTGRNGYEEEGQRVQKAGMGVQCKLLASRVCLRIFVRSTRRTYLPPFTCVFSVIFELVDMVMESCKT